MIKKSILTISLFASSMGLTHACNPEHDSLATRATVSTNNFPFIFREDQEKRPDWKGSDYKKLCIEILGGQDKYDRLYAEWRTKLTFMDNHGNLYTYNDKGERIYFDRFMN